MKRLSLSLGNFSAALNFDTSFVMIPTSVSLSVKVETIIRLLTSQGCSEDQMSPVQAADQFRALLALRRWKNILPTHLPHYHDWNRVRDQ